MIQSRIINLTFSFCLFCGVLSMIGIYCFSFSDIIQKSSLMPFAFLNGTSKHQTSSFQERMESLQAERRALLWKSCRRMNSNFHGFSEQPHLNSFYSNTYMYAVCHIYKCGFTSWLLYTLVVENLRSVEDYQAGRAKGYKARLLGENVINLVSPIYNLTASKQWLEALKIITVRNPFARLVSAFYDKLTADAPGHTYLYKAVSEKINRKYRNKRKNETARDIAGDGCATFEDFVNFLVFEPHPEKFDIHWIRYNDTCHPCEHQYDYIFKFETMVDDVRYLKDRLNFTAEHRQTFFPSGRYRSQEGVVQKTFASVPRDTVVKLYERYKVDFDIFGYDRPNWL